MTKKLLWMKWCPRDFAAETRSWPLIAKAICRELFDAAWDAPLPAQESDLRRITGATAKEWRNGWPYCSHHFPLDEQQKRSCPWIDKERQEASHISEARARSGAEGARNRWQKGDGPQRLFPEPSADSNCHPVANGKAIANSCTSTSTSDNTHTPDSEPASPRRRARPAVPTGPRARPKIDPLDEARGMLRTVPDIRDGELIATGLTTVQVQQLRAELKRASA